MRTLEDAWNWYRDNRQLLQIMSRMGRLHWNDLPWDGPLGKDHVLRDFEGIAIQRKADSVLAEFDDLAIFVIFSVFEAIVRDQLGNELSAEIASLRHVALVRAAERLLTNVEDGSFYNNVLELYKSPELHYVVEEVSQVRQYRNWVAHGRRPGKKPFAINPKDAFDRLQAFLEQIGYTPPVDPVTPE